MMRTWVAVASAVFAGVCGVGMMLAADAARADWRADMKVLRVGFLASAAPAADIARMEPFRAYIEARIGLPVELVPASTYDALIDAEISDRTQYAIHSATSYAAAEAACACLEPLAISSAGDGSTGFYSILLVRADSGITSLAGARGMRLALTADDSVAGRLVPMKAFAAEGIEPTAYFSAVIAAPGPEAAIRALFTGETDVAVGWSSLNGDPLAGYSFGVLTRMVIDGVIAMDTARIIWQSRLIPFGPHAVRATLDPELKTLIADALFAMVTEAPDVLEVVDRTGYGGGGFVPATDADYAVLKELVAAP